LKPLLPLLHCFFSNTITFVGEIESPVRIEEKPVMISVDV